MISLSRFKRTKYYLFNFFFLLSGPCFADGSSIWMHVARSINMDPRLFYSIALQESRKSSKDYKTITPWPWALNTRKYGGQYFESYSEALSTLRQYVEDEGIESVDIGIMQINWQYNKKHLPDLAELLKPSNNIRVGAIILKENLERFPDLSTAIARYNSNDPKRGTAYAKSVFQIYEGLKKIPSIPGITPTENLWD